VKNIVPTRPPSVAGLAASPMKPVLLEIIQAITGPVTVRSA
jgi:hypothetical protein